MLTGGSMSRVSVLSIAMMSLAASTALASAADLPLKARPAPPVATYSWTGCYVGGNAGGAWSHARWTYTNINPYDSFGPAGPILASDNSFDMSSWIAGVQAGCNYQLASKWVVGFEGGWSGTDLSQTNNNVVQVFGGSQQTVRTRIDSIATATARVGYAVSPLWLLYAKGGYAGGQVQTSGRTNPAVGALVLDWDTSKWHDGWTIGAGGEYRLAKHVSVGLEYGFVRLSADDHVGPVGGGGIGPANQIVHSVSADVHSVTARVNFLFGGP